MKMAKASENDLVMANKLAQLLECLLDGEFPYDVDRDETDHFDVENHRDCEKAFENIFDMLGKHSLFRVVFGMQVVCDPRNELLDPDADTLEVHPKFEKLEQERDSLAAALRSIVDQDLAFMDGFVMQNQITRSIVISARIALSALDKDEADRAARRRS